jgi:NAD(P)-dependent dehydrogenase (short-subunit alcohol dehydrogenase family)
VSVSDSLPLSTVLTFLSRQHCYVTGGSAGLGLALALILARKGAHVTIVARGEQRLKDALEKLEVHPIVFFFSAVKAQP